MTSQGLKLTSSRRPGDVINCNREINILSRVDPRILWALTSFFLFMFSTLSANQNGFAVGEKDLCEKVNGKRTELRKIGWRARVCVVQ